MAEAFKESPNFSPSARLELGCALQHLIKYIFHNLEGMVAAKIVKYDRNTHVATVLPLVNIPYPDGNETKYAENEPFDVSVMMFCHGGFLFDMPLAEGDTGWVIAADRDTTLAKQNNASVKGSDNNGTQRPNSLMRHKYSQGFFIPDSWAKIPFDDEKFADKFVIGDIENVKDPSAYLTIDHDGNFLVHADNRIDLLSKLLHISGDVEADGSVDVKKDLNIGGNANVSGNLTVDGQQNRINDCTEQEVEVVQAEELPNQTVLKVYKTHVFHNGLRFVKNIVVKTNESGSGEDKKGGGGEGEDTDTVIVAPFLCRRVFAGNSEIMFYLPEESAIIDDKLVDFSTNFNTVSGNWKKSEEADNDDTVWCWVGKSSSGSYVGHMANERVLEGTYTEDGELVVCCFAVCEVGNVSDMSIFSGISQLSYGTLALNTKKVHPFSLKYDSENEEMLVYLPDCAIVHMKEDTGSSIANLPIDTEKMTAASSGESGWYVVSDYSTAPCTIKCVVETTTDATTSVKKWNKYYVTAAEPEEGESGFKVADIVSTNTVKQYAVGSIIINSTYGNPSEPPEPETNEYWGDDRSITNYKYDDDTGVPLYGEEFYLVGFGMFTGHNFELRGKYRAPEEAVITEDGIFNDDEVNDEGDESGDTENMSVLVRIGNEDRVDANFLRYKKLRAMYPEAPFHFKKVVQNGVVQSVKIVHNKFFWNGVEKNLNDFDITDLANDGLTVYLVCKQTAPTAETPDPEWTFELKEEAEDETPEGGKLLNYPICQVDRNKVVRDYRHTFLSLEDFTQKAKVTVAKPSADTGSIVLDTTPAKPKIVITDSDGHTISLDLADGCGNDYKIRPLTYYNSAGVQQTVHVLACGNINIPAASQGTDVTISGGTGIKVNSSTGTGSKSFTISNKGVLTITGTDTSSAAVNGTLTMMGVNGSGIKVKTIQQTPPTEEAPLSNGTIQLDIEGRSAGENLSLVDVTMAGDDTPVAKVVGTTDFEIATKEIRAGTGISVTESTEGEKQIVTIALGSSTGFTGTKTVIIDMDYDTSTKSIRKKTATLTYDKGVLTSWTDGTTFTAISGGTAVEES